SKGGAVEPTTGLEPVTSSLPRKCSTTELGGRVRCCSLSHCVVCWVSGAALGFSASGRPGSNRRRSAWKADALPTELLPRLSSFHVNHRPWRVMDSNHRRHSRQIYSLLPLATRATLR